LSLAKALSEEIWEKPSVTPVERGIRLRAIDMVARMLGLFTEDVKKDEDNDKYDGAARFEMCGSRTLFAFTGSTAFNLRIAIRYLCDVLPELKDLKF
jgi:hypothetical protein